VTAAKARADKLTQAILAKAFRGERVPTEAELVRREGRDYEPASVLLERIQAERAQSDHRTRRITEKGNQSRQRQRKGHSQ
jgi:type I restriction enzyme S subunit